MASEKLKFSLSQQHPITSTPALPTCTGFKISLLESLHEARSNISNANVFNEQQRRRKFKDLVSNVGVYQTQNLAFLADVVRLLSNHFQLTQSWQRRVLKDEMGSLAGGLFLGFNADSGDFPDLVRLAENLMLLMIQLGDLDNAKFVFQQVKELGSLSDELTVLSLLAGILGGNTSDAESSLALFEDTSKDNAFLFELLLSCRLLLFCKTYSSRGPDTSLMFSTLREYTSLVREKILTGGKYPSCPETLSACGLGIASVVFLEIRKRFARSFQTSVLSLLLNNSRFEDFHPESSFLKLFSLCLGKLAKLGEHFFGDTEQTSSLRAFETLTQTRGATSVLSEVSPCSVEYDYVLNCQFFVSAIHRGRVRDLAEYLSHKKAVNLDLNNHLSFLFFEVLACYLNQNGDKCLTLLRKTFENIDKKSFIKDTQVNYGMLQILYVIEHLLCCNRPQTQVLKPEIFQQVTRLCPEILPWNELTLLLESDRFFKSHKLDKAINCLLVRGSSRVFACLAIEKISCFSKTYKLKCLIAYLERSLDFGIVFRIVDVLCEQCELQKCLEVVDFLIQNWKSAAWFDLIKLLKSVVPSSSSFDCPDLSPLLVDKTSASPLQVKVSYFISPDELCVLNLLKGRLLTRLSLTRKALEFYQKMVASPNSSFFILDFAMLLVSEGEYLSTLNLLNLEFYFQKCPRSAEYLSFDQIFKQEHAARVDFQITELQLVRECLLHLTGDLPANQNSEDILSKLESLQQNPGNSCSRHFRSELRLTSRFLLKLSEVRLARGNTRNPFKLFIDAQSHLVLGIKHCPHVESQEYSKLEKMVSQKPSPFAVEDFLSASMSSSSELDRATCFQIQRCLQRESRLFVSADDFSHTSSTFEVFGFLKNLNTQQMSKRKNKSKHSMTSSVLCSGSFDMTPPYLGKLFLASYADKENASDLRLISNLKTNTFRSPALTLTYSSTENLFRLRNIQVARENQNFERLKAESKGVLKSEFKPEAVWGLADALLPKKRHAASADGFFKMLKREQATTQKDRNLVFSVGVFLLQGGLFAECLEYLNLLLEPARIQFLQKISTPLPQVSEKENQDHLLNTEYVLPQSGGPLVQINSRAQCARSFYSLYDDIVLKHQTKRRPQLAFLLGVYFYKIKRLDPASKSFIRALESPFLQVPSLLHLLDISLHETSYNLYSNHFHKEKYSRVSDGNRANLSFAVESLVSLDIPAVLKRALRLVLDFVRILNAKEGTDYPNFMYLTHCITHRKQATHFADPRVTRVPPRRSKDQQPVLLPGTVHAADPAPENQANPELQGQDQRAPGQVPGAHLRPLLRPEHLFLPLHTALRRHPTLQR